MAKFFLTNNAEWYQKTKELITNSEFKLAFDYAKEGIYALTTHKLKIKNKNAYDTRAGDFVIATGTAVYKASLDYSNLLNDFSNEDAQQGGVCAVRANTVGQYAYALKQGDEITIFGDGFGAYDIYYYYRDGYYYVSNFLYDMACVLKDKISVNELNVIENAIRRAILCNETVFNEISNLNGDEFISIKKENFSVCDIPYDWSVNASKSSKEASKDIAEKMEKKAKILYEVFGSPNIFMTGGLDSRMSLAAYLNVGAEPMLSYGLSNTHIAYPDKEDADIVHDMASTFGLKDNVMLWDTRFPDKEWDKELMRYGFLYEFWCGTDCMMKSFEDQDNTMCTFGLGGEMYRTYDIVKNNDCLTEDVLLKDFYFLYSHPGIENTELKRHLQNKLRKIASKYHVDINHIKPEEHFYFDKEVRRHSDAGGGMANLLNLIRYSEILLLEQDVVSCTRIPVKNMEKGTLLLQVMHTLYPHVLNFPIHSHHELCTYNPQDMTLVSGLDAQRSKYILHLKKIYHRLHRIELLERIRYLYKNYERFFIKHNTAVAKHESYKSAEMKSVYKKIETSFCRSLTLNEPSLAVLHTMNLKAINSIMCKKA